VIRKLLTHDAAIAGAVALFAAFVAFEYLAAVRANGAVPFLNQEMFGPAVMQACGRGFVNPPPQAVESLDTFLAARSPSFSCLDLPPQLAPAAMAPGQDVSRYLLMASALCWRVAGVRWSALDWLAAALFVATAVAFYVACRAVAGRVLSTIATLLACISPLQLTNLPNIRDYSKAPFFAIAAAGIAWVLVPRPARAIVAAACLTGALIGVGVGFRADVMLYLPALVAALALSVPAAARSVWRVRLVACTLCVIAFFAVSWPILRVYSSGQSLWHVALLGLTTPLDDALGIRRSLYDFGDQYRDAYVSVVTNSYWLRTHHEVLTTATYAAATGEYYRRLFVTFPADFVTRAWAAVLKSLDLPFDLRVANVTPDGITAGWLSKLYWYRWWTLSWFQGLALPLLIAFALKLWNERRAAAVFLMAFVSLSAGITSLQYQPRHIFHLELVACWIFAAAFGWIAAVITRRVRLSAPAGGWRGAVTSSAIFVIALVAVVAGPVLLLRAYQSYSAATLLTAYESAPQTPVEVRDAVDGGIARLELPALAGVSRAPAAAEMIVTTVDTDRCREAVALTIRYARDPEGQFNFTRSLRIEAGGARGGTRVLFPVYFAHRDIAPRLSFVGLEVAESQRQCVGAISRFAHPDTFALLLTTELPPDWRARRLYERIDPLEIHPSMVTPFVGKLWYRGRTLLHL
jgi:hypothetical protein